MKKSLRTIFLTVLPEQVTVRFDLELGETGSELTKRAKRHCLARSLLVIKVTIIADSVQHWIALRGSAVAVAEPLEQQALPQRHSTLDAPIEIVTICAADVPPFTPDAPANEEDLRAQLAEYLRGYGLQIVVFGDVAVAIPIGELRRQLLRQRFQ